MMHWWRRRRKIVHLPGTVRDAVTALASTLEKAQAGLINSVYIGIEWEDGTFVGDWSNMSRPTLAAHAIVALRNVMNEID